MTATRDVNKSMQFRQTVSIFSCSALLSEKLHWMDFEVNWQQGSGGNFPTPKLVIETQFTLATRKECNAKPI